MSSILIKDCPEKQFENLLENIAKARDSKADDGASTKIESMKAVLTTYFSSHRLSVYSFAHIYYQKQEGSDKALNSLNAMIADIKEVVNILVAEFYDTKCPRNVANGIPHIGNMVKGHCEHSECNMGEKGGIYTCPAYEQYYHIIRRITKFFENLESVQHRLISEKNVRDHTQIIFKSYNEDIANTLQENKNRFDESLSEAQSDMDKIQGTLESTTKTLTKTTSSLKKINRKVEDLKTDFLTHLVAVMSVFTGVIMAVVISINVLDTIGAAVFAAQYEYSPYAFPTFIVSLCMFFLFNLVYFFFCGLYYIIFKGKEESSRSISQIPVFPLFILINIAIVILASVSACSIYH